MARVKRVWVGELFGLPRREVGAGCWGGFLEEVRLSLRLIGKTRRKELAGMCREWRSSRRKDSIGNGMEAEELPVRVPGE